MNVENTKGGEPTTEGSPMEQSKRAYREYEIKHKLFEGGDPSVSESDVSAAYSAYLHVHNDTAGKEGYEPYSPHEISHAKRPRN